jgi:hypothetical protein
MQKSTLWAAGVFALLASAAAFAIQDAALLSQNFDSDSSGWNVESSNAATTEVTKTAGEFKTGTGALKVKYTIEKGQMSALSLPVSEGKWAKMEQVKLWLKTDKATPIIISLYEKDGGHYNAALWSPKGIWQQILLVPSDFTLSTEGNEPKDPNNRLDRDAIEKIVVVDVANLFIQADNPANEFFKVEGGQRTMWLDDFEVRSDKPADPKPADDKSMMIDDFRRDFLTWLPIGQNQPVIQTDKSGKPLEGRALKVEYMQEQGKFAAVLRTVSKSLAGNKSLAFDMASEQSTKFIVMIEEKTGGRYNAMMDVDGEKKALKKTIAFSDFTLADDSPPDANGKLDLDNIKHIAFADTAGFMATEKRANTIWLANLRAVP